MDDIKLFSKNEKEIETLTLAVRIYTQDIGMEFGLEKCALFIMKSGKQYRTEWIELPNQDKIRMLREKETYKYLGILEVDTINLEELKEKTRKLLETKLRSRNFINEINTRAVPLVKYSGPFLNCTREESKQMENSWQCSRPYIQEMT